MTPATISKKQFYALRAYLDNDARSHIQAHGRWSLDEGKLSTALREVGVQVQGDDPPKFDWAVAMYGTRAGDDALRGGERLSVHLVRAELKETAIWRAAVERGEALGSFDGEDQLASGNLLAAVERIQ